MIGTLWMIALRHLTGRKRQTLTTLTGVAVSTMVLITTLSLTRGLLDSFVETIVDVAPHITLKGEPVTPARIDLLTEHSLGRHAFIEENVTKEERDEVRNYRQVLDIVRSPDAGGGVLAASEYVESQVMVINGNRNEPLLFKGVEIEREDRISRISSSLVSGSIETFSKTSGALLVGRTVADDLEIALNDEVTVVPASGPSRQCKVAGIFFTGVNALDNTVLVKLRFAQQLEGLAADKVSGIALKVADPMNTAALAMQLQRSTGYRSVSWQEENASILSLFNRIGSIVLSLVGFVGIVSGFGVANILVTTIFEKSRDIAILKSYGFSSASMIGVFVLEGFLVGFAGALFGAVLATGSIGFLENIPVESSQGPLTKSGFSMSWNPLYFLLVIFVTSLISTVAAAIPALKAARMEPVVVLRDSSL
ncbi:MAG TPA: ABC transporter permease [Prosthecochloris aestuarii]|uniref:ABC transporter permease n=1 Tax=Prosthecochloris aestuarii TaxID=1102 RepID=A0A831STJ0_PROAE|nr:ABC transporter permease [Prosthecochloris aestuarii]